MGWFDEQIRQRKQKDNDVFAESLDNIVNSVTGKKETSFRNNERMADQNALNEIMKFYHLKGRRISEPLSDMNEQIEYLTRPYGMMHRTVWLERDWYKDAAGAMLGTLKDSGRSVALIPGKFSGYRYYDSETGKRNKIGRKNQKLFEKKAILFYKPFPAKKMGLWTLLKYMLTSLSVSDYMAMLLAMLAVVLIGSFMPKLNQMLFSYVLPSGSRWLLLAIFIFMVCVSISGILLESVRNLIIARIDKKLGVTVDAAAMMRVMTLPAEFFRNYSSGELYSRIEQISSICDLLVSGVFSTGITSVFSLVYIWQIFSIAPALAGKALMIIFITVLFSTVSVMIQTGITQRQMEAAGKESAVTYDLITGIQKIKLTGSEKRAFARWGNVYAGEASLLYDPPLFLKINSVISTAISLTGTIILYYAAVRAGVSVADYYAFNTAYGMISGAFLSLAGMGLTIAQIGPSLKMIKPVFDAVPEVAQRKEIMEKVSGEIELNHVSFRYSEDMPFLLDDLSLKIKPGQYVAIVGETGCGKSTLLRLLLGFEKPQKGAVYYDKKDIDKIDLKSLRQKIGTVMQNGKLFQGDIYTNITFAAPWLTRDEAWKAAELAGIAEDIRNMPMGMDTMISEGSGGISGGQKQRIMIARAIAPKPRILMLDEATSALDNLTQKKVSEALDSMKCTRIVIAHRLSTIRHCDRILVLKDGKIAEDGNYDELMEKKGIFAELAAKQNGKYNRE